MSFPNALLQRLLGAFIQIGSSVAGVFISQTDKSILSGNVYTHTYTAEGVAAGAYAYLRITTTDNGINLVVSSETEGKGRFQSFVNTAYSADGAVVIPFNRNTDVSDPSTAIIREQPTVSAQGDRRFNSLIPGNIGFFSSSGGSREGRLFSRIGANTDIIIGIRNDETAAQDITLEIDYIEETQPVTV